MSETILQIFLTNQFIKTADARNIDSLNKAVTAVKALLIKKKQLIIPYTLVALDPQISGTDPVVTEVESIIIKNWSTFKNSTSTKDKPTTYVRVVILQALADISKDDQLAAIIWLAGRNVISSYNTHKEKEPMANLLVKLGTQFEVASRKNWSLGDPVLSKLAPLNIAMPATAASRLNKDELVKILIAASVHNGWTAQAGGGENPSYPAVGDWKWAKFFSEKLGQDLTDFLNKALTSSDKSVNGLATAIQKEINIYFAQFQDFFKDIAASLVTGSIAANKRGELLWWKQALYSTTLNTSYRSLSPIGTMIAMVTDFADLVGMMHPESVNYLLKEAFQDVHPEVVGNKETLTGWVNKAIESGDVLKPLLSSLENEQVGRKSLGTAIANALSRANSSGIATETGIDSAQEFALPELATWLFHDLQALKFAIQK
jgi:hypothetical protein